MKHNVLEIAATIFAILILSSCEEKNITLGDLSGSSTNITLTCTPKSLTLCVGEVADIAIEVSGARKESSVSCLSSNSDVAEAYEADARAVRVRGVSEGKAIVSVSCENSDAVKVEVTVNPSQND